MNPNNEQLIHYLRCVCVCAWSETLSGIKRFAEASPSEMSSKIQNPNILFSIKVKHGTETQETARYTGINQQSYLYILYKFLAFACVLMH